MNLDLYWFAFQEEQSVETAEGKMVLPNIQYIQKESGKDSFPFNEELRGKTILCSAILHKVSTGNSKDPNPGALDAIGAKDWHTLVEKLPIIESSFNTIKYAMTAGSVQEWLYALVNWYYLLFEYNCIQLYLNDHMEDSECAEWGFPCEEEIMTIAKTHYVLVEFTKDHNKLEHILRFIKARCFVSGTCTSKETLDAFLIKNKENLK